MTGTDAGQAILTSTLDELNQLAKETEQPAYRAKQLKAGLLRGARNLEEISDVRLHSHLLPCRPAVVLAARPALGSSC